jgi:hypothetical protein
MKSLAKREWSVIMEVFKMKPGKTSDDRVAADDGREKRAAGRRKQDTVISINPDQKINMDRRVSNSDRRIKDDPNYNGPSRRYTIDRRLNLKDRRDKQ